jgi:hypothetical protein
MNDKELHRNTFIFAGIVIAAIILWAYFHDKIAAAMGAYNPQVQPSNGPIFAVFGAPTANGPVYFPSDTINIPATPPNGVYNPSSCECGCSGGMGGPVTFSFPDMTTYYTQLQEANNMAINQAYGLAIATMPYDEGVFVADNTPTPFG